MKVVGLDLSLTSTGVAVSNNGAATAHRVKSSGKLGDTLAQRRRRLGNLASGILVDCIGARLVVIEQPAFSKSGGSHHDRSGLWWLVVDVLIDEFHIEVAEVPPTTLKKYVTGVGNASKDDMLTAVIRRYPDVEFSGNDEADAVALMAMGLRHLGAPIDTETKKGSEAMSAVRWP